jgi:hypothetical protein
MLARYTKTIRRKWQAIGSAIAVLLMFFVPATRVILASTKTSSHPDHQANANHPHHSSAPTTPPNPSPMHTSTAGGHHHQPHPR